MSMHDDLSAAYGARRVLVTGHTGFKGGWMALWLRRLGAQVTGIALPPPEGASFAAATGICDRVDSRIADIRDPAAYAAAAPVDADLVIHMAAQPIVRRSYADPVATFATNVTGTAVVLDAARRMPSLKAVIVVTSDKCYENVEQIWGYREIDRMGGSDPYSASKGCAELVAESFRRSFFADPGGPQLASVRAGNVFGGGDWGEDRLIPDFMRAAAAGTPFLVRNPASVRPWQHVLDALQGYLKLGAALLSEGAAFAGPWNFGPDAEAALEVGALVREIQESFGADGPRVVRSPVAAGPQEAAVLRLDSFKARSCLGWRPRLAVPEAIRMTVAWHRAYMANGEDMLKFSERQIEAFERRGEERQVQTWSMATPRKLP